MSRCLAVLLIVSLSHGNAAEYDDQDSCPAKPLLDQEGGFPQVFQVNSTTVSVDWSDLWPSLTSECIDEIIILVNGQALPVLDNDLNQTLVNVEPCVQLDLSVQIRLNSSQIIESYVNPGNKTYLEPAFKESAQVEVNYIENDYGILDLQKVQVSAKLLDIVDNIECRLVENVELLVFEQGQQEPFFQDTFATLQQLEMNVPDLTNFCSSYDFTFRLHGTAGNDFVDQTLVSLEPVKDDLDKLLEAQQSGFKANFLAGQIQNLTVASTRATSILLQWSHFQMDQCLDGFVITLQDTDGQEAEQMKIIEASENTVEFKNLTACTKYIITARLYLGKEYNEYDGESAIFQSGDPVVLTVKTMPDMSAPFALTTLKAKIERSSLTFVWKQSELNECISYEDLQFSVCEHYLQRGSCLQNVTGIDHVQFIGDEYYMVNFEGLQPCKQYQLLIEHAQVHQIKADESEPAEYDDAILIDDDGQIGSVDAWGTIWYTFATKKMARLPRDFGPLSASETAVTLTWRKDACATDGYTVSYGTINEMNSLDGSKSVESSDSGSGDGPINANQLEDAEDINDIITDFIQESSGSGSGDFELDDEIETDDEEGSSGNDIGSGDYDTLFEDSDMNMGEWLEYTIEGLDSCTRYNFFLNAVGDARMVQTSTETDCLNTTTSTTTEAPTTEATIEQINPLENVTLEQSPSGGDEGTLLQLSWLPAPKVEVTVILESRPIRFTADRSFPAILNIEELEEPQKMFLNVPSCQEFNVSMKVKHSNGTFDVPWFKTIKTLPPPLFNIPSLKIDTKTNPEGRGESITTWNHTLGCIDKYAIVLAEVGGAQRKGEMVIQAPKMNQKMSIDMNLFPGLLTLKNCQKYQLWIYPDTFPNNVPSENRTQWHEGLVQEVSYEKDSIAPNGINPKEVIKMSLVEGEKTLDLTWGEPFICTNLSLKVIQKPYLYKNHSKHEITIFQDDNYQQSRVLNLDQLLPCMSYRYELSSSPKGDLIYSHDFKTAKQEDVQIALEEHEVIVWTSEDEYDVVAIEWADRCVETYRLDICQFPYDCYSASQSKANGDESFYFRTFQIDSWEMYPKQTVTDLLPCAFYSLDIYGFQDNFPFHRDGAFITSFSEQDFDLNLHDFTIGQKGEMINMTWTHVHPCISGYSVELWQTDSLMDQQVIESPLILDRHSLTPINVVWQDNLEQCMNYELIIKPFVNVTEDIDINDEKRIVKRQVLLFNQPKPPKDIEVLDQDEKSTLIQWEHVPCYDSYVLTIMTDDNTTQVSKETIEAKTDEKIIEHEISELQHCTAYTFFIQSVAEKQVSGDQTAFVYFTRHADFIHLKGYADYHAVSVHVGLHGVDCVSHYKLFLCDQDNDCQDRPVTSKGNVTFDHLKDGQSFTFQLIGYDDEESETYVTETFNIDTPLNVTTEFKMDQVTNTTVTLNFHSSIFDHFNDLKSYSIIAICDDTINNQVSRVKSITLEGMTPFTDYECQGQFEYDNEFYDIPSIHIRTLDGIPSAPLDLTLDKITHDQAAIEWYEPKETNGNVQEYKIELIKKCQLQDKDSICHELCTPTTTELILKGSKTSLNLDKLLPWSTYEVRISARTSHIEFGPWSQILRFKTLPGAPSVPIIVKTIQTKRGGLMIDFRHDCPLTGPTSFTAQFKAVDDSVKIPGNVSQTLHRPQTIELVGLEGGHFYEVWIRACVENHDCQDSKSHLVEIECEYKCSDGTCIHWNAKCNYIRECPDGSDEANCPCEPPMYFKCDNHYCIPSWRRCDNVNDCYDMSDEKNCPSCVGHNEFRCHESGECLPKNKTCDRRVDCRDGSDESGCPYWRTSCWPEKYRCLNHKCVDMKHRCDQIWDCEGGEDEISCDNGCRIGGQWACRNRECIAMSRYCDGVADCQDGSDEFPECRCHKSGLYACRSGDQCISRLNVCDGVPNCADGSDERTCRHAKNSTFVSYSEANILYQDYAPPSLESANLVQEKLLDLKVYPEKQSVYKNSDVVLQCRDEGQLRAQVEWIRADHSPMPKHAKQHKGRLEIRRIGFHEGGLFLCRAIKHASEKGGQAIANVEILRR